MKKLPEKIYHYSTEIAVAGTVNALIEAVAELQDKTLRVKALATDSFHYGCGSPEICHCKNRFVAEHFAELQGEKKPFCICTIVGNAAHPSSYRVVRNIDCDIHKQVAVSAPTKEEAIHIEHDWNKENGYICKCGKPFSETAVRADERRKIREEVEKIEPYSGGQNVLKDEILNLLQ